MAYPLPPPKRRAVLGAALAASALAAVPARAAGLANLQRHAAPRPVPALEWIDADDNLRTLAPLADRVIVINFWATWCVPCVKEMPSLDRLQGAFPVEKLVVLPLSVDGPSRPRVAPFYRDRGLRHLGIFFDRGRKTMQALGVTVLPTTLVIDRDGHEVARLEGEAEWDSPDALAFFRGLVA